MRCVTRMVIFRANQMAISPNSNAVTAGAPGMTNNGILTPGGIVHFHEIAFGSHQRRRIVGA